MSIDSWMSVNSSEVSTVFNLQTSTLRRRKSLLMPSHERRRRREKVDTDSIDSDNATSDNFSQPSDEHSNFSDFSSGQSFYVLKP